MTQLVGVTYKSLIPELSDDATIEDALRMYHYGVSGWTIGTPVATDSIEGNFISVYTSISALDATVSALGTTYVRLTSLTVTPNVIIPQTNTGVPLTLRGAAGQTGNILQVQNSSSTNLAIIFNDGAAAYQYVSIGTGTKSTTVALNVQISDAAHKGAVVKGASAQTANLQEWQNSAGSALAWVDKDGRLYAQGTDVSTLVGGYSDFLLMGG